MALFFQPRTQTKYTLLSVGDNLASSEGAQHAVPAMKKNDVGHIY